MEEPSTPSSTMFEHRLTIESKALARPQGFKYKTMSLFSAAPRYSFSIVCTSIPTYTCAGNNFNLQVHIHTNTEYTTATIYPDIVLEECTLTIVGITWLSVHALNSARPQRKTSNILVPCGPIFVSYPTRRYFTEPVTLKNDVATLQGIIKPAKLFSKAHNYTMTVSAGPVPKCHTYATENYSRRYLLKVRMVLQVGKQKLSLTKELPLEIRALGGT